MSAEATVDRAARVAARGRARDRARAVAGPRLGAVGVPVTVGEPVVVGDPVTGRAIGPVPDREDRTLVGPGAVDPMVAVARVLAALVVVGDVVPVRPRLAAAEAGNVPAPAEGARAGAAPAERSAR